jgi:hypothetical protein
MRLVRQLVARRDRVDVHEGALTLFLEVVPRYAVGYVSGLAEAGGAVGFPVAPGADDVPRLVEAAFSERAADMIADARHRSELAIRSGKRDVRPPDRDLPERSRS